MTRDKYFFLRNSLGTRGANEERRDRIFKKWHVTMAVSLSAEAPQRNQVTDGGV